MAADVGGLSGLARAALQRNAAGELDIRRWAVDNGIAPNQFIELPRIPNPMLPPILREMHCAVQVSRCEPCTKLPAKEAMACGVPVIVARNTGARDLIDGDNCWPVLSQGPVAASTSGTDGWGESSVEEIVHALEALSLGVDRFEAVGDDATRRAPYGTMDNNCMTFERELTSLI